MEIRIDPEFQNKIPPLTDEEFKNLEELILQDGRVKQAIVVWNNVIVDGHHRWKIVQKHPEIPYEIEEKQFVDKWEAFNWMYMNQLGRRNLSDEQRTYIIGKMYEARKHTHGGDRKSSDQSGHLNRGRIKEQIAKEQGIGQGTVQRAEEYAKGIDAIRDIDEDLADSLLNATKKVSKTEISTIGKSKPEERKQMIDRINNGEHIKTPKQNALANPEKKCDRSSGKEIREIINAMSDETEMEYTLDTLNELISANAANFVRMLSNMLGDHSDLCCGNEISIAETIRELVIEPIKKILKEKLNYET